jgi:hypothetical protein
MAFIYFPLLFPKSRYINERGEPVLKRMTPHDVLICECGGLLLLYSNPRITPDEAARMRGA